MDATAEELAEVLYVDPGDVLTVLRGLVEEVPDVIPETCVRRSAKSWTRGRSTGAGLTTRTTTAERLTRSRWKRTSSRVPPSSAGSVVIVSLTLRSRPDGRWIAVRADQMGTPVGLSAEQ